MTRLDPDVLRRSGAVIGNRVLVFEETDSTNDLAARAGDDGLPEGLVIFAESQRAGRGRLGRKWTSTPGQALLFSVLLRPATVPSARWPELTFCAALAVAETAEQLAGQPARVKWPNDVLVAGRKIAGILLETHHRQTPGFVVVGIGVNVSQQLTDFAPELRERAGSLAMAMEEQPPPSRHEVAALLLERLGTCYSRWPEEFASTMQACRERGCESADL